MEAQLTLIMGRSFRLLALWMHLAMTSLPTPLSPCIKMVQLVLATLAARLSVFCRSLFWLI